MKDIRGGRPVTALLSDASAIPETPGTVDLFAHQIDLAVSGFQKYAAGRMLRPTVGVRSRLWETAGIYADLVSALAERPAFGEPIARRLSWSRDPKTITPAAQRRHSAVPTSQRAVLNSLGKS